MPEQTVDIIQQVDEQGNPIAGLTPARAVYDEQGTSLDVHLAQNLLRGDESQLLPEVKKRQMRANIGLGDIDINAIADKTNRLTTLDNINTNLVNPTEVEQGYTLNNQGGLTGNPNVAVSEFIPVEEGKTYTLFAPLTDGTQGNVIVLKAYNSNKNHTHYSLDRTDVGTYTVPSGSGVAYIRIVGASNTKTGNPNANKLFGCFEGENATFEEWHEDSHQLQYNDGISFEEKDNKTLVNKGDVISACSPTGTTSERPTSNIHTGRSYFDKTLNKPIWYNGTVWVDATGATV